MRIAYRHNVIIVCFVLAVVLLIGRLFQVTVIQSDFLQSKGDNVSISTQTLPVQRAVIYDRMGKPLAVSTPVYSVWINPRKTHITRKNVKRMCRVLNCSTKLMEKRLKSYKDRSFVYLIRRISPTVKETLDALGIDGLRYQQEYRRYYPAGEVAAHVVGITDVDNKGQEGIEIAFNDQLSVKSGKKRVIRDNNRRIVEDLGFIELPRYGEDVHLSIDLRAQFLAYRELKKAILQHKASSGSVVILDAGSGEVLALANYPSYNPNKPIQVSYNYMRNRAVTDLYEPGSTMKPFTILCALENEKVFNNTEIDTSPGYIQVGSKRIRDPINYGTVTLSELLAKSSQVGIAKIALQLSVNQLFDMYERLGIYDPVSIELPGGSVGTISYRDHEESDLSKAALAYGYGVTLTPMHLAHLYLLLANQGMWKDISILKNQRTDYLVHRVFEQKHVEQVIDMLRSVVDLSGTGRYAALKAYDVAGKTGTVRKIGYSGYDENRHVAYFAGIVPVDNPKLVVLVLIDEPKEDQFSGGDVAAPVFASLVPSVLQIVSH